MGRLARVLRYLHGDNVPFPMSRTPEEYAAFIVACDTPGSPHRRQRPMSDAIVVLLTALSIATARPPFDQPEPKVETIAKPRPEAEAP